MSPASGGGFTEVEVPPTVRSAILRHGERAYPEEACGFLLGIWDGRPSERRTIRSAREAANAKTEERTHRFVIPAPEVLAVERDLERTGEAIVGYYHSHPDHPAVPSEFDREHAWPGLVYLVLAVDRGRAGDLGAFELDPETRTFQPRRLFPLPTLGGPP
jgi:proteasome lid subunit RPN8/RPN11